MANFDFEVMRHMQVEPTTNGVRIGGNIYALHETLICAGIGDISGSGLHDIATLYARLSNNSCHPQLAALVFDLTRNPRALDHYFPITRALNPQGLAAFDTLTAQIAQHPGFDLRIIAERKRDITQSAPPSARILPAGQLAEVFFGRPDILSIFLSGARHILLYTSPDAFTQDGGFAGGDYNPSTESVQLVLARMFEGYNDRMPGVAPFLHELGHMLDFFDARTGRLNRNAGLLPGMRPSDGAIFTPRARDLFVKGKALERERYVAFSSGRVAPDTPMPIGHPYCFQNDTEFMAGYFEMFFRNPHYFAAQNPDLFGGFAELLRQDTRAGWPQDFAFYVTENRKAYAPSATRPKPTGITLPKNTPL